jgi:hypothetical protein
MAKPATCLSRRHGRQDARDRAVESPAGACFGAAPGCVALRPPGLERRQVRRGGRPIPQPDATPGPPWLEAPRVGSAQVVQDDEGSCRPRRPSHRLHSGATHGRVQWSVPRPHGVPPLGPQGASPRHLRPIGWRDRPDHPRPFRRTTIQAGQGQIHAGCLEACPSAGLARGHERPVPRPRRLDPRRVTLGGLTCWCLRGRPRRLRRRDMGGTLPHPPRRGPRGAHPSATGASGGSRRLSATIARAALSPLG